MITMVLPWQHDSSHPVLHLSFLLWYLHCYHQPLHRPKPLDHACPASVACITNNITPHTKCQDSQVNSASYPQWDGKWVVAYGLWGEGLVWLIGAVVCLLAANRWSNCSLTRAMDGRIVRCGIISLCQSVATSEIVKRFWSRVWLM